MIPATQKRKSDAAQAVNDLRTQGLEVHTATSAFKAGNIDVKPGDYVIRGDQPYRTVADMYFSDPELRAVAIRVRTTTPAGRSSTCGTWSSSRSPTSRSLTQQMTLLTTDAKAPGGIEGTGPVVVVDHTTDNSLVTFRFKHAEREDAGGGSGVRGGGAEVPRRRRSSSRMPIAPRSTRR